MNKIDCFVLGSLFTHGISYTNSYPSMQVLSIISLYYMMYMILEENKRMTLINNVMDLHGLAVLSSIVFFENFLVTKLLYFFRIKLLIRLGAFVMISGFILSALSVYCLKNSKSVFICHGPYRFMRMPYFMGVVIFIFGSSIYMGTYISLFYIYYTYKAELRILIEREEAFICREDEKYRKYMTTVKKFVIF